MLLRVCRRPLRAPLLQRGNLLASGLSTSSAGDSDEDSEKAAAPASPHKYDNVRKLIVGLGNPGDKFTNTRCDRRDFTAAAVEEQCIY